MQYLSLGQEMATHSTNLAWETSRTEEPGRIQSRGSQRVKKELVTKQQHSIVWHSNLTPFFFFFKAQHLLSQKEFLMNLNYVEKMPMTTLSFSLLRSPRILLGSCMTTYIWIVTYKLIYVNCSENAPRERLCFRKICIIMNFHFC